VPGIQKTEAWEPGKPARRKAAFSKTQRGGRYTFCFTRSGGEGGSESIEAVRSASIQCGRKGLLDIEGERDFASHPTGRRRTSEVFTPRPRVSSTTGGRRPEKEDNCFPEPQSVEGRKGDNGGGMSRSRGDNDLGLCRSTIA